jgi:hypothetical protein
MITSPTLVAGLDESVRNPVLTGALIHPFLHVLPRMQNTISVCILLAGLLLALVGSWMIWGPPSALVVVGSAMFVFGLASID